MDYLYETFLKLNKLEEDLQNSKKIEVNLNNLEDEELEEELEIHDELNPLLWEKDNSLKVEVKETIIKIVEYFTKRLERDKIKFKIKDIVLVGSNCAYNYTADSDLDVHIVAESEGLECPDELYTVIYSAYKSIFNNRYDISIKGIPVELYVELDEVNVKSKGIYSLNDGWIKEPSLEEIPEIDEDKLMDEFKKWEHKYFEIIGEEEIPDTIATPIEDIVEFLEEEELDDIDEDKEKPDYEWLPVPDKELELLDKQFEEIGFDIVSKERYDEFGIGSGTAVHYQILSKEKINNKDEFRKLINKIEIILDEFEDITGSPCTYNIGHQTDMYVSAGIDCRVIYHKPGDDIVKVKPTKIKFSNGVPATERDIDILKHMSDKVGQDITSFIPTNKKTNESFKYYQTRFQDINIIENLINEKQIKIEEIEDFIEDIYDLRKKSIAEEGEYGIGNLIFKEMRNLGYINNLRLLRIDLKAKELSLEQLNKNNKEIKESKGEGDMVYKWREHISDDFDFILEKIEEYAWTQVSRDDIEITDTLVYHNQLEYIEVYEFVGFYSFGKNEELKESKEMKYKGFIIERDDDTTVEPFFRIYKEDGISIWLEYDLHSFEEAKQYIDERESDLKESILQDYINIRRDLVKQYGEEFYDYMDEYLAIPEIAKTESYDKIIYSKDGWNKFAEWCNTYKGMNVKLIDDQLEEAIRKRKRKKKNKYYQKPRHCGLPISMTRPSFWKSYEEIVKEKGDPTANSSDDNIADGKVTGDTTSGVTGDGMSGDGGGGDSAGDGAGNGAGSAA